MDGKTLFDIALNSSVPPEDALRLSRQCRKMYRLFAYKYKLGLPVSTAELDEIGDQYQARLYELRRALIPLGFCIDLVWKGKGGINHYKMVPLAESKFYRKLKEKDARRYG